DFLEQYKNTQEDANSYFTNVEDLSMDNEKQQANLPPQSLSEQPKKEEKPADEFDALKARFDKVVYAKRDAQSATDPAPTAATPAPEVKKETIAAPAKKEEVVAKEEAKDDVVTIKGKKYYTVKKGDTAFGIAKNNHISMRELLDMNDLDFRELKVGQKLRIQ
ncbi:MAG: LysM peptidoglycan-binding domain-containing protein, partial [Sphingobacteriales bacterium]